MTDCVFCKIISGEIPAVKLYDDEDFIVIQALAQASKGHSLIIPKKHSDNILEMDSELASKMSILAKKIFKAMKQGLGAEGSNIIFNNGLVAGQEIMHTHMHLIPRYKKDDFVLPKLEEVSEENRVLYAEKIINNLS